MDHRVNRRYAARMISGAAFGSLLSRAVLSQSASTPSGEADPVVARVLNTEIRASQKGRLLGTIFAALLDKYAKDRGLSASEVEIARFRREVFTRAPDGSSVRGGKASESKEQIKSESDVARNAIVAWKRNRALFKTYGGRVIFQQMGYEPIDAYKAFLEEQQRLGAFEIIDKSLEPDFWAYFVSEKHLFIHRDGEEVLGKPFWESK